MKLDEKELTRIQSIIEQSNQAIKQEKSEKKEPTITEQEALREEEKLQQEMEMFFQNNPAAAHTNQTFDIEETEEELVKIDNEGQVTSEAQEKEETLKEEVFSLPSFVDEEVAKYVIENYLIELARYKREATNAILKINKKVKLDEKITSNTLDYFIDNKDIEKRRVLLNKALRAEVVSLDDISEKSLQYALKSQAKELLRGMFQLVKEFE